MERCLEPSRESARAAPKAFRANSPSQLGKTGAAPTGTKAKVDDIAFYATKRGKKQARWGIVPSFTRMKLLQRGPRNWRFPAWFRCDLIGPCLWPIAPDAPRTTSFHLLPACQLLRFANLFGLRESNTRVCIFLKALQRVRERPESDCTSKSHQQLAVASNTSKLH